MTTSETTSDLRHVSLSPQTLPSEIRYRILEFALANPVITTQYNEHRLKHPSSLNLLMTCKTFLDEGSELYYRTAQLHLDWTWLVHHDIPGVIRKHTQHVTLHAFAIGPFYRRGSEYESPHIKSIVQKLLDLSQLQVLDVDLHSCGRTIFEGHHPKHKPSITPAFHQ